MTRYFIELSYNGKDFHGWQRQPNSISVQEVLEDSISKLYSNTHYPLTGCGRTDTGVHAKFYIAHIELPQIDDEDKFVFKINRMLPDSIAVSKIYPSEKHARFDASERTYRYFVHQKKDPFIAEQSWYVPQELDFDAMNEAAQILLGKQDFTSLAKLHTDVKTHICDVRLAKWYRTDHNTAFFEITADRFLRNMVRATVGTLVDVGLGKLPPSSMREILDAKDRQEASTSVPGHALFLWDIKY